MFFVELKPVLNIQDNAEYIQQCKLKFELHKYKRNIAQSANCRRYGHSRIIATSILDAPNAQASTSQTNSTEKKDLVISHVSSVVGTILRISRDIQSIKSYKNILNSSFETIHSSCTNQTYHTHSTRSNVCSNNQHCHKYKARATNKSLSANKRYTKYKNINKYVEKPV
jgi:hypothetical protein